MPFEILGHTADVRLRVWGKTLAELFEAAAYGLMAMMQPVAENHYSMTVTRHLEIQAGDSTELLIDFLNQILTLAQTNRETYPRLRILHLGDQELEAELDAVPVDGFGKDVKAVTYHEAEVKRNEGGDWETLLVLDI